jgi:uncharacterized membrane protein YgdD (TMEM256/DUF423 family)
LKNPVKNLLAVAAIYGFLGVAIGAFGAHKLQEMLAEKLMNAYEKGVLYQFIHTFAIIAAAILLQFRPGISHFKRAGWAFAAGILVFSGSLYIYALSEQQSWGMITPIGGVLFLLGWAFLFLGSLKLREYKPNER